MKGLSILVFPQQDRLRKKLFEIIDKKKAGEKIPPPKKVLFGLLYKCPKCNRRLRKQKYTEFATAFASTSTFLIFECECGWENEVHK